MESQLLPGRHYARRAVETAEQGQPTTPFLSFGDRVRIEMRDRSRRSVFGAIEQEVVQYEGVIERVYS